MSVVDKKVFFCCGPKVWTQAIGWLELIFFILVGIAVTVEVVPEVPEEVDAESANLYVAIEVAVLWVVIGLAIVVVSMLLLGNAQGRSGLLVPWLIFHWMGAVSSSFGLIGALFTEEFGLICVMAVGALVEGFFLYVVHQRRKEILVVGNEPIVGVYAKF